MSMNKIKNFVIVALVITAVYQTGMLWLEDSTGRNIFYYVYDSITNESRNYDIDARLFPPEEIIIGYTDKKYYKKYSSDNSEIEAKTNDVIKYAIENGQYMESQTVVWEDILQLRSVIYNFPFMLTSNEYVKGFDVAPKNFTLNIQDFDTIVVSPAKMQGENVKVWFINSERGEGKCIVSSADQASKSLYAQIENVSNQNKLTYISSQQSKFNIFKGNVFIPELTENKYAFKSVECNNPYIVNGETDVSLIESNIEIFFPNSASIQNTYADGVYTFSNRDTVVKYSEKGVLEYYNYNIGTNTDQQTLATAFTVCDNFITKDLGLNTQVSLKNVELKSEGLVFYYDYVIEDMDIIMSEQLKAQTGMQYAMEVVISNNEVKKYRRITYNFSIDENSNVNINTDFSSALSNLMTLLNNIVEVTEVEDIELAYSLDMDNIMDIKWFITVNGTTYSVDSYYER